MRPGRARLRWLLAALALVSACDADRDCVDCHVVLITVDTLRADHVSGYGYTRPTTPRIDAFFANGTRFRHAISPSPCTIPSVGQLLTGQVVPEPEDPRLAELLARGGWSTRAVVSQHFFRDANGPAEPYARGFERFDVQAADARDAYGMTTRTATEVTDRALAVVAERDRARPLFLWVHYFDPHDPYTAPAAHRRFEPRTSRTIDGDRRRTMRNGRGMDLPWERRGAIFTSEEVDYLVAQYDAEIHYADSEIGRLLEGLEAEELVENALVVLTADHGERLGEDDKWDHCWSLHRSEMRVPLLVRHRGGPLGRASEVTAGVSGLDILPTVLDATGLRAEAGGPGRSLLGIAAEGDDARVVTTAWKGKRLALAPPWKLVVDEAGSARLHHVDRDPTEHEDLAALRPEVTARLRRSLDATSAELHGADTRSDEIVRQLEALGYLE
jgi:arylsulfatase